MIHRTVCPCGRDDCPYRGLDVSQGITYGTGIHYPYPIPLSDLFLCAAWQLAAARWFGLVGFLLALVFLAPYLAWRIRAWWREHA